MKKLILITMLLSSICQAEQVNWRNLYHSIAFYETSGGKNVPNRIHRDVGILQINQPLIDDLNNVILKGKLKRKLTLRDALNNENSYRMMYHWLKYWGDKYEKRTGIKPSYLVYGSIWRWGYGGLKRKGRFNTYAINVRNYAAELDWSDRNDRLYAEHREKK